MKQVNLEDIKSYRNKFEKNTQQKVVQRAVVNNGIGHSSLDNNIVQSNVDVFSIEIDAGEIHDQENSGRCWLFAAQVLLEPVIAKKLKVKKIKLSKNYTYFYDKFEMCNAFYQKIIDTKDLLLTDKKVQYILRHPQGDGGWWNEAVNLIEKYGVVPDVIMPETHTSKRSNWLNSVLNEKLRADVHEIRNSKNPQEVKANKLAEIYEILAIALGTPPEKFTYEFMPNEDDDKKEDKTDKQDHIKDIKRITATPQEFHNKYGAKLDDFFDINFIGDYKKTEFDKVYEEELSDLMYGKNKIFVLTRISDDIKESMVKQLQNNEPIWFWWDVTKQFSTKKGVIDAELFKYKELFGQEWNIKYEDKGLLKDSNSNLHATAITGVHLENNKPVRWKVKNSWGSKDQAKDGWVVMNDNYLDHYILGVTLRKKYLSSRMKKMVEQKPIKVSYWD